jgi:hypothetical protein
LDAKRGRPWKRIDTQDRRPECDRPNGRIATPVSEALTTLTWTNPQIVESIFPARVLGECGIAGIEPEGFHVADRCTAGVVQHIARARQRGGDHTMQILGIHTHALSGPFERTLKIRLLLQQTLVARPFVVVHLGPRPTQPLGVVFFRDRTSDRRRLAAHNPAFSKPLGDAVLNDLADRPELFADGLRFSNQRLKYMSASRCS